MARLNHWSNIAFFTAIPIALFFVISNVRSDKKRTFHHSNGVRAIAFLPDGNRLAAADTRGHVMLWDIATQKALSTPLYSEPGRHLIQNPFCSNGKTVVRLDKSDAYKRKEGSNSITSNEDDLALFFHNKLTLFNVQNGQEIRAIEIKNLFDADDISWIQYVPMNYDRAIVSPGGKTLVTVSCSPYYSPNAIKGNRFRVWNTETGTLIRKIYDTVEPVGSVYPISCPNSFAISTDSKLLACARSDEILVWNAQTGGLNHRLAQEGSSRVIFSPDGKFLASGSNRTSYGKSSGEVKLWNMQTGQVLHTWIMPTEDRKSSVGALAFSADGSMLAAGGLSVKTSVWDVKTGKLLRIFKGWHKDTITAIAFSPDGKTVATGSGDKTVKLWKIN